MRSHTREQEVVVLCSFQGGKKRCFIVPSSLKKQEVAELKRRMKTCKSQRSSAEIRQPFLRRDTAGVIAVLPLFFFTQRAPFFSQSIYGPKMHHVATNLTSKLTRRRLQWGVGSGDWGS